MKQRICTKNSARSISPNTALKTILGTALAALLVTGSTLSLAEGLPTGKRQHKPITVIKEVDKASPAAEQASTGGGGGAGKVKFDRLTIKKRSTDNSDASSDTAAPARQR